MKNPYIFRSPSNSNWLLSQLFSTAWTLWQTGDNPGYGVDILWELSKKGMLCDHETADPFKSKEKMIKKFEEWIEELKKQ